MIPKLFYSCWMSIKTWHSTNECLGGHLDCVGPETSGTSMKHEAQAFVSSELTDKELEKIQHCCLPVFARFVEINHDTILSVYHFYCNLICLSFFFNTKMSNNKKSDYTKDTNGHY